MEVAKTILQQLGGSRFVVMTGSKNFVSSDNSLSFKVGSNSSKVTHVRITLTGEDLYDVVYMYIRGTKVTEIAKEEGLYFDMLQDSFTKNTGLHTHL
jgi:hypothetical protein